MAADEQAQQLLVRENSRLRWYQGTPEELVAAGILTAAQVPPIGRGSITFYDGQEVGVAGWIKGRKGVRAVQDELYVKVMRNATGRLTVMRGTAQPRSEPEFRRFLGQVLQPVDVPRDAAEETPPAQPISEQDQILEARARWADEWWNSLEDGIRKLEFALHLRDFSNERHNKQESIEQRHRRWADEVWRSIPASERFAWARMGTRDGKDGGAR